MTCWNCGKDKSALFVRNKEICYECFLRYMIWLIKLGYAKYIGYGKFEVDRVKGWQFMK